MGSDNVSTACIVPQSFPSGQCEVHFNQILTACGKRLAVSEVVNKYNVGGEPPTCLPGTEAYRVGADKDGVISYRVTLQCDCPDKKKKSQNSKGKIRGITVPHGNTSSIRSANRGIHAIGGDYIKLDTTIFSIPIGATSGDTLTLQTLAFLPPSWSYTLSDSMILHTPDTLTVKIVHDRIVKCADTARVLVHAYDKYQSFAGYAEVRVNAVGKKGDVNGSDTVDVMDIGYLANHLFQFGSEPTPIETGDINGDGSINIADLTNLIDLILVKHTDPPCIITTNPADTLVNYDITYTNDTTNLKLITSRSLKGIQLEIKTMNMALPIALLSESLNFIYGISDSIIYIGILDTNGITTISPGTYDILKIPGRIIVNDIIVSDTSHQAYRGFSSLTGVLKDEEIVPNTYELFQSYPNPFNPTATIEFSIPERSTVNLRVYNILGQEIAVLSSQQLYNPGFHEVSFDCSNCASGLYFYRLEAISVSDPSRTFIQVKKMILLK